MSGTHPVSYFRMPQRRVRPGSRSAGPLRPRLREYSRLVVDPARTAPNILRFEYNHTTALQADTLALGRETIAPRNPFSDATRRYARRAGESSGRKEVRDRGSDIFSRSCSQARASRSRSVRRTAVESYIYRVCAHTRRATSLSLVAFCARCTRARVPRRLTHSHPLPRDSTARSLRTRP